MVEWRVSVIPATPLHSSHRDMPAGQGHPHLVARQRLLTALEQAASCKVTIITAPAGSGKSSLLRSWADRQEQGHQEHRLAIVQVQHEPDGQLFWLAVLDAVRGLAQDGDRSEELPAVASPDFSSEAIVDRILGELAACPGRVSLLIDDVHELTSPEAQTQLTRMLTQLSDNAHVILAARRDLPLRLHRLRLDGQLAELRAADLRFTEDETRALLKASGIVLSDGATARLHERTEGWAAGLRLAVLSLHGHPDPERFVTEFGGSDRTVAEYLVAEMLDRQPQDVQDMLLRTSILTRVSGDLADALTGRPGSERILLGLEDANAFVVSLDAERTWFRYHHLFAELLQLELRRVHPDEVRGLHRRAAAWFTDAGMVVEAVRHTQAAGDWAAAAKLFGNHSFGLMLDGQQETMQSLLDAFPSPTTADLPELSAVRAMLDLWRGRLDEAAAHLAVTTTCITDSPPERPARADATVSALSLELARRRGDLAEVMRHAALLTAPPSGSGSGAGTVATSAEDIALGADLRVVALMNLGMVEAWSLGLPDGAKHLAEAVELARFIGRPYLEVAGLAQLGFATKLHSFTDARRISEQALALAAQHGWETAPILAPALVAQACTQVFNGEFDRCEVTLTQADEALRTDAGPDIGVLHRFSWGLLHLARGRMAEAEAEFTAGYEMQAGMSHPHVLGGFVVGWLAATRARLGAVAEARALLATLDDALAGSAQVSNARAVIALVSGDPVAALAATSAVVDGTVHTTHVSTVVEAHVLAGLAHSALGAFGAAGAVGAVGAVSAVGAGGAQVRAWESVERALAASEPERLILPFVMADAGALLESVPRQRSAYGPWLTEVLDVIHGAVPATAATAGLGSGPVPELSATELRVLRYLPTNLSRPEIASELSVSVNTVSTHVRRIYAKLQATDRSSAVQRARELHLLGTGPTR
ncbi:helix-turn-helix transcriptional regulator [Catenulispora rubra]|uniref:helix-turn-helix transcriptional regulator n=1 Tax=Catenulispora rubra TaxID=280293 RepID=UPI001E525D01|nr:LuxR C-terminal-related transcriptional regulator [Catenulispora rubra]